MKLLRGTDAHGYIYSLSLGRMPGARGEVVTRQRLDGLASEVTAALQTNIKASGDVADAAVVGHATAARAVSNQSFIRNAQGRPTLLDAAARRLSPSRFDQGPKSTGPSSKLMQDTCLSTAGQGAPDQFKLGATMNLNIVGFLHAGVSGFCYTIRS